jgi:hypothetical protein
MIGIATMIFWIFLIAFSATAVYSIKDLQFSFGQPLTGIDADSRLLFSLPITIGNKGLYNIDAFNVTTLVRDPDGFEITRGSTYIPVIRKGEEIAAFHNLTLDINELLQRSPRYLFEDMDMKICASAGLRLAQLIPVQASTNLTMPWGAPLHNFTVGQIEYLPFNATHFQVTAPVSFENHAFFDLAGDIQLRLYDSANVSLGSGRASILAPQGSRFNGNIEFYIMAAGVIPSGHFDAYLFSPLFNYGPWVIPFG